jgi:hypothetical protein
MPPKDRVDVSVTRTEGCNEEQAWADGQEVGRAQGRAVLARGDLTPAGLRTISVDGFALDVEPDEPPRRHANIVGFPSIEHKQVQKLLAARVADTATLREMP